MRRQPSPEDVCKIHHGLVVAGALDPLKLGGADERTWMDCDLASLAENRIGDTTDPRALDAARRATWEQRALTERPLSPRERSFEACFWLVDGGERAGTVALSTSMQGFARLRLSSLYVLPTLRGRGVGTRALQRLRELLAVQGVGIRLDTSWSWQRTVRFYLRRGLWVHTWKDDLSFKWDPGVPPPVLALGEREASLSVELDGRPALLARAERAGDALVWHEDLHTELHDERLEGLAWAAGSTLGLVLAMQGWPLIRSKDHWEKCRHANGGPPESLAYKIVLWEAWDRKHGFNVDAPRIPGLAYPSWSELDARWNAEIPARPANTKARV